MTPLHRRFNAQGERRGVTGWNIPHDFSAAIARADQIANALRNCLRAIGSGEKIEA